MEEHGYSVIRALGQGGCNNRVYEVRSADGHTRVVKQLPWVGEKDREHALLEVELLASLRHPCIVHYIETFLVRSTPSMPTEDVLCLVMSRCERDLRQECLRLRMEAELLQEEPPPQSGETDQQRPPTARFLESHILSWLSQLCWGLQHLHSRKFLHRDLKPQNVLMSHASTRVLLADFGIAAQVESTEGVRSSIVGTPAFMSPEMLEGRPYGLKTDQWALGCVLFEMMALEPPFASSKQSYAAVVEAVLHAPQIRPPPGFSPELGQTMEALLARKPHDRPSNRDLLRGPLLRPHFQGFMASLRGEWRTSSASPAEGSPTHGLEEAADEMQVDACLRPEGSPEDSLHLPSVEGSPMRSASPAIGGLGIRSGAQICEPDCIEEVGSYASDFTSLSGEEGSEATGGELAGPVVPTGLPPLMVARVAQAPVPAGDGCGLGLARSARAGMPGGYALAALGQRPVFSEASGVANEHLPLLRQDLQDRPRGRMLREVGLSHTMSAPAPPNHWPAVEESMHADVVRVHSYDGGPGHQRRWASKEEEAPERGAGSWMMQGPPGRALRHHGVLEPLSAAETRSVQFSFGCPAGEQESSGSGFTAMAAALEGSGSGTAGTAWPQPPQGTVLAQLPQAHVVVPHTLAASIVEPAGAGNSYSALASPEVAASEFGASEWRLLLDEAEALLQSPAEPTGGFEEAQKIRMALAAMLGAPAQVDKALAFLRKRKPLGDTVEADELLLQVELLDLLGEEALHTLPLLEKLQALEDKAPWLQRSESPDLELPSLFD